MARPRHTGVGVGAGSDSCGQRRPTRTGRAAFPHGVSTATTNSPRLPTQQVPRVVGPGTALHSRAPYSPGLPPPLHLLASGSPRNTGAHSTTRNALPRKYWYTKHAVDVAAGVATSSGRGTVVAKRRTCWKIKPMSSLVNNCPITTTTRTKITSQEVIRLPLADDNKAWLGMTHLV